MFNNFFRFARGCLGIKLLVFISHICLIIITLYQLLLALFSPCFGSVFILLFEYLALVALSFWLFFGL